MARGTQKEVRVWLEPDEFERLELLKVAAGEKRLGRFITNQIDAGFKVGSDEIKRAQEQARQLLSNAENRARVLLDDAEKLHAEASLKADESRTLLENLRREKEQVYGRVYALISAAMDSKLNSINRTIAEGMRLEFLRQADGFGKIVEAQTAQLLKTNAHFFKEMVAVITGDTAAEEGGHRVDKSLNPNSRKG
jgi:vacuolar-type H+-ATPase subunit H